MLRPGGTFAGSVPNAYRFQSRLLFLAGRPPENDPTHLHMYSPAALEALLAGFAPPELSFVGGRYSGSTRGCSRKTWSSSRACAHEHSRGLMRLFRRNALGIYATYGAAIVSGLVVTPIVLHELGTETFGIWSFIGSITVYLMVLDFGVGPSIVRFAAEARGRRSPEDTNALASVGLALYAVIGAATLPVGLAIAWLVPELVSTPDDLVWPARISTFLVVLGIAAALPARSLQQPAARPPALRPPEPRELPLDCALRRARRVADPERRRADPARRADPGDDAAPACPAARLAALGATGPAAQPAARDAGADPGADVVQLEQLPRPSREHGRLLDRRRRGRDRARRRGGRALRDPGEALQSRPRPRQRRLEAALPGALRVRGLRASSIASAGCC